MISNIITYFAEITTATISSLGYFGLFIIMLLESCAVPIPSELVIPFAGFLVFDGEMNFWIVTLVATLGNLVGSIILYYVGQRGGRPFIEKYGKYFFVSHKDLDLADRWFSRYGRATIFFTRVVPIIRTFISLPAGISSMPMKTFIPYTFLGSFLWSAFLAFVGVRFGKNWDKIGEYLDKLNIAILVFIGLFVVWYVYKHIKKSHKSY